jgi:hypothetical protein
MVTRSIDGMVILRQNAENPADAEWDECLRLLGAYRSDFGRVRVLVVTDGGGPTPAQRKRLSMVTGGYPLRAAVVTESVKVRFIVSSVALFMSGLASFDLSEMRQAFAHLKLDPRQQLVADRAVREMTAEITGGRPTHPDEAPRKR